MNVTGVGMTEREQNLGQVERLVNSQALHGSESLCKLLRYLAKHALDHPGVPLKEYQIATEVFGRPPDFDPQLDSTVRVQAGRLRVKLAEYYGSEATQDSIVVELPKGAYAVAFHHRTGAAAKAHAGALHGAEREEATTQRTSRNWAIAVVVLTILLAGAVAWIVSLLAIRRPADTTAAGVPEAAPAALRLFWKGFVSQPGEPWVIFSNAAFVGRPETGMHYFDPSQDAKKHILDHYTGVGEVLAVHALDQVFGSLRHGIRVKRGSLFSLDDAKNNDLIFIGSPSENLTLLEVPGTQQFLFQRVASGPRKGDLAVVNLHPQPGEAKQFLATPSDQPLVEDYSVVALVRGMNPAQSVLILAGTTTIGTQAAVEYVCRQDSVEQLLLRLSVSETGEVKPFEAVLRVRVIKGVPVETQLVALRKGAQ